MKLGNINFKKKTNNNIKFDTLLLYNTKMYANIILVLMSVQSTEFK